jgi:hypothetical protein
MINTTKTDVLSDHPILVEIATDDGCKGKMNRIGDCYAIVLRVYNEEGMYNQNTFNNTTL